MKASPPRSRRARLPPHRHHSLAQRRQRHEMARAMNTTLFVHNGPCVAALGSGSAGYLSFSIATPTGEGVTRL